MLNGKTAVITGASRGIGAAVAYRFASLGANVAVVYAGKEEAARAVCEKCSSEYGVKALCYRCDVADFAAVKQLSAQIKKDLGTVHILVNNAGINRDGLIAVMKEADFDDVIATNLKGAFNMIRHFTSFFLKNRQGAIINISSIAGLIGNPGQANYAASKAGIIGLTKSVARELASRNVTCNAIAPGFIATDMTKGLPIDEEELRRIVPLGRMGDAESIADAAAYLAQADYVTGEVLRVDGGAGM